MPCYDDDDDDDDDDELGPLHCGQPSRRAGGENGLVPSENACWLESAAAVSCNAGGLPTCNEYRFGF